MNIRGLWTEWKPIVIPVAAVILIIAAAAAVLYFLPSGIAATFLGVVAAIAVYYGFLQTSPRIVRASIMWAGIAIGADAAYAKLNDQTPVTLANALTKFVDAIMKLAGILLKNAGPRILDIKSKLGAFTPDFVWAFILILVAALWLSLSLRRN